MKTENMLIFLVSIFMICSTKAVLAKSERGVGLGASFGVVLPEGHTEDVASDDWDPRFNWGFYVDIPLVYTFHITPSAELYKFKSENATDICLGFKFIIPLGFMDLFVGVVPGLTTVSQFTAPHVGGEGGVTFHLVSNFSLFLQGKYKVMFQGNSNIRVLHLNAGALYRF